nr:PHP domain-containing protein [Candidatus Sigynarchaeota archaeon]
MIANLHLHSVFSDGTQWPEEIVVRAKHAGYQVIALTDHDTMQGTADFTSACKHHGIASVPGVEIDCIAPEFSFDKEMLGYFPRGKFTHTIEFTEHIREDRMRKIHQYLDQSRDIVFKAHPRSAELTYTELVTFKLGFCNDHVSTLPFSWNKSNFYYFLCSKKILDEKDVSSKSSANEDSYKVFKKKYFMPDLLGDPVKEKKQSLDEVVAIMLKDGGFPILPHYGHLYDDDINKIKKNEDNLLKFLRHCRDIGVWGVEQYYYGSSSSTSAINDLLVKICKKYDLGFGFTFGSDCHGRGHETCTLELFSGDFPGFPGTSKAKL